MSQFHRELDDATAAAIVRAGQKDEFYLNQLTSKILDVLKLFSRSRNGYINTEFIGTVSKLIYFGFTTALGFKTFGEQYVDLNYVNGGKRVKSWKRVIFVLLYALGPYWGSKLTKLLSKKLPDDDTNWRGIMKKVLNYITTVTILDVQNLHLALFYLGGRYYYISKRVLGLRYGLGYKPPPQNQGQQHSGNSEYEVLGVLMIIQLIVKYTGALKSILNSSDGESVESIDKFKSHLKRGKVNKIPDNMDELVVDENDAIIDLADPTKLTYISSQNRSCMLCLDPMKDPSCGPCGHIFCWSCILEWCKERSECPLCRSPLRDNQLIPLK